MNQPTRRVSTCRRWRALASAALPALALAAACAAAHVTLEQPVAAAGSAYKAVLRVTHGCEGSATHTVVVELPPGFRGAKPQPKAGWTLQLRKAGLAEPYDSHGRTVSEDVVQVTWKAASREAWLDDAHFDEFVVRGQTPLQTGTAWFKVRQLCERGEWYWVETPPTGQGTRGLKSPAVPLQIEPAASSPHRH